MKNSSEKLYIELLFIVLLDEEMDIFGARGIIFIGPANLFGHSVIFQS